MSSIISIKRTEIPAFLDGSDFYCYLNLDAEEEITVPADCFKVDDSVTNADELRNLLSTLRFWAVSDCPRTVLEYILSAVAIGDDMVLGVMAEFQCELQYLTKLRALSRCNTEGRLTLAIRQCNLAAARFIISQGAKPNLDCFLVACESGNLESLQLISEHCNKHWLAYPTVNNLIVHGYLECIQYLHDNGFKVDYPKAVCVAASYGHRNVLQFYIDLHSWDVMIFDLWYFAAVSGHLVTFQCAYEARPGVSADLVQFVCEFGRVEMLKYLHSQGVHIDTPFGCARAARRGNLDILQYLHEQGCEWTADACTAAASHGHLECLQYLHQHGCPWSTSICNDTVRYRHISCLKYLLECGCELDTAEALKNLFHYDGNHESLMLLLHEHGAPL